MLGPFTVDELLRRGLPVEEACSIAWVTEPQSDAPAVTIPQPEQPVEIVFYDRREGRVKEGWWVKGATD